MTMVSSRDYKGYRIDAVWEHSWDEPERYTLTVTAPDGCELGQWNVQHGEELVPDLEERALDFGEVQADAHLYRAESDQIEREEMEGEEMEGEEMEGEEMEGEEMGSEGP